MTMMTTAMTTTTQNPSGIIFVRGSCWRVAHTCNPAKGRELAKYDGTRAAAATAVVHWQVHLQAPAGTEGAVALHQQAWRWRLRRQVLLQVPGSIHKAREFKHNSDSGASVGRRFSTQQAAEEAQQLNNNDDDEDDSNGKTSSSTRH